MKRSSGVLINVSSLPSEFGIGGFGKEIEKICQFLNKGGFSYWQVLPLTTIGLGNSPYSGSSAFAVNYLYVDPNSLFEEGYIDINDLNEAKSDKSPYLVNYEDVYAKKSKVLRKAYNTSKDKLIDSLEKFAKKNTWVVDYSIFMTLKKKYNNSSWLLWDKQDKYYENIDIKRFIKTNNEEYYFYVFEQYVLKKQWQKAQQICKNYGIKIIGDMPMYVSLDSVDVWANRANYQLYKNGKPKKVAGVPPDYFSQEGQLWGNPLYDYTKMKQDKFSWWIKRIDRAMQLYDVCRIDHFRAFSDYPNWGS